MLSQKFAYLKGSSIMNDFMGNRIIDVLVQWHNHVFHIVCINLLATWHAVITPSISLTDEKISLSYCKNICN